MNSACVFSIDDTYVMPFQVFFHSLEATSSIPHDTPIFILHTDSLGHDSIAQITHFLATYSRSASYLDATDLIPRNLPIGDDDHVSPATFYRLFIAEILPPEIDQAVYLDVDMLALRSIAALFTEPVDDLVAAADQCSPADAIRLWGAKSGTYFQAGVLVIPLLQWRIERLANQFVDVMATQRSLIRWWDQDVLNIVLRDRWQRLPVWYNACEEVCFSTSLAEIEEHGRLIHFNGGRKPWNAHNPSPFTVHWDRCFYAVFGVPFDRAALLSQPRRSLKAAFRSRLSGLIHGRV